MTAKTMVALASLVCATVLFVVGRDDAGYAILILGGVSGGLQVAASAKKKLPPPTS